MKVGAGFLLLFLSAAGARSLPSTPVFGDRIVSFRDGLPGDQVVGIEEDHLGYLWLGTTSGLARLAEPDIEVFGTADGLPSRTVYRIAEDSEGILWVGTLKGLAYFDGHGFISDPEVAMVQGRIRDLERAPDGTLWVLASPGGLWRRRARHWTRLAENILPEAIHMAVDSSGTVWLGGADGLGRYQFAEHGSSRRWEPMMEQGVLGLAAEGSGVVAVTDKGLRFFGHDGERRVSFDFGSVSDGAVACSAAPGGVIYLGTSNGVVRFDRASGRFDRLRSRHGGADSAALCFRLTRDGNLWIGSVATGASLVFTGLPVAFMNYPDGVPGTQFYTLSFLSAGEALMIEEQGLFLVGFTKDGSVTSSRKICSGDRQGCPGAPASIVQTGAGEWLVGGTDGIRRLHRERDGRFTFTLAPEFSAVAGLLVIDLAKASDGTVWIATPRGPLRMRPGGPPELVPLDDPNPGVRAVDISPRGRVWLITQGGRIWSLAPGESAFGEVKPTPGRSAVENMFLPQDGQIWITRSDGSCEAFDPETARGTVVVGANSIFPGLSPASFVSLGRGRYLAGHRGGFSIIRLAPLAIESRLFSPADLGDPDLAMSGTVLDPGRAVWLSSLGSLIRFDFENFRAPASAPLSVEDVFDFRTGRRGVVRSGTEPYIVEPRPNATEILLACPDHVGPREVRFRSRLVGEDAAWGPWSADRRVRLVNLPAGSYRFEAQALDRFGRISPGIVAVGIDVRARFWETWLFRVSLLALLALIIAGSVRWRVSRLIARQEELERIVDERTQELARANALLAESSLTDPLTGLRNRRYLAEVFARDIANQTREARRRRDAGEPVAAPFYFLLLDLDHFKETNDRFGHAAGDAVLKQFASILREETRKGDICVRWGGEEFLVVSRQDSAEGERVLAERIRSATAAYKFAFGPAAVDSLHVTCSAGFVSYPVEGIPEERLTWADAILLADHALYHAKQNGRNRWVELLVKGNVPVGAERSGVDFVEVLRRDPAQALRRGWIEMKGN